MLFKNLKWTCHVCGRERPDNKISVATHMRKDDGFELQENIRYCNDSKDCKEKVKTFHFLPECDMGYIEKESR